MAQTDEMARLLRDIEDTMIERIPATLRNVRGSEPAYCLFICYHDTSFRKYPPPYLFVGFDRCREQLRATHPTDPWCYIWFQQEVELIDRTQRRNYCEGFQIDRKCQRVFQLMCEAAAPSASEEKLLLPFRSAIHRVASRLNQHNWDRIFEVTDDFVVFATDSIGYWVDDDMVASIPAERLALLKSRWLKGG